MKNEKMFENAIRKKLRYHFNGMISTEDLWDLSVESLDSIFKELNSQVKQVKEESLLDTKSQQDEVLELKIDIVKYIVTTKLGEAERRAKEKEIKQQEQRILEIISSKKESALENKSVEELEKMVKELRS